MKTWHRIGGAFLLLAGYLVYRALFRDSGDSPETILGMLAMFGLAAVIWLAIVTTWKWLSQLWSTKAKQPPTNVQK